MVWVLSKEEFALPKDVTGLATLRTTFTKQGILALNVGNHRSFFSRTYQYRVDKFFGQAAPHPCG